MSLEMGQDGMGWSGMGRDGVGCNKMGWDARCHHRCPPWPPKPHSPHQLLVVQRPRGLPAQDVDLALEDGEAHGAHHRLLRAPDALPEELALGAVPEACGQEAGSAGTRGRPGCPRVPRVPMQGGPPG